jgi:5-methylcytosine-specific restriction endonuclease McrA
MFGEQEGKGNEMKCVNCGCEEVQQIETPNLIHYAKEVCKQCGRWIRWIHNPENEGSRTQTSKYSIEQILRFHKKENNICFFCLRTQEQLGVKETFTRDHIEELDKGGKDELENLQILCSPCHKLKNWTRTYINWHFKNGK